MLWMRSVPPQGRPQGHAQEASSERVVRGERPTPGRPQGRAKYAIVRSPPYPEGGRKGAPLLYTKRLGRLVHRRSMDCPRPGRGHYTLTLPKIDCTICIGKI